MTRHPPSSARGVVARIVPGLALGAFGACVHAAIDCAALVGVTTADATMTSAATVPANTVISGVTTPVAMCRVQGTARPSADSEIKFEVWLPDTAAAWTGRMKVNGTGGYAGSVPYARLGQDVGDGFVSAGSNMGHDGGEAASWTLNRPEKVKDWGLRAHYSVATAAKALAAARFGGPVRYSYFEGCSNGGRQALMMAQNYPQLFDGIVAGAPSNFYPDLLMWLLWTGKTLTPSAPFGPPAVSDAKRRAVTQKVVAACDAADGLVDGQITNPRACTFNIDSVGPSGDGTLTAAEVSVFKAMYAGTTSESGVQRYTGARLGSEADWSPLFADNGGYGNFISHYVYGIPAANFNWRTQLNYSGDYDAVKQKLTPITAAPSPDLRAFRERGGKIVQVHGWNDSVVPPDGSIGYFHSLALFEWLHSVPDRSFDTITGRLTPKVVAAVSQEWGNRVREFHRLFMLPAVGHCGGSTGPSSIGGGMPEPPSAYRNPQTHAVSALMQWVEAGVAPEKIVASSFNAQGVPTRQRPVCPYPAEARYTGSGSIENAANFSCVMPRLNESSVESGDLLHIRNSLSQRRLILPNR